MEKEKPDEQRRQRSVDAIVRFSQLMHSYERGDLGEAAAAQEQLERLGISVRFRRPQRRDQKGGRDAK